MRTAPLLTILLLASPIMPAQQSAPGKPTSWVAPVVSQDCPINFGAKLNSRAIARSIEDQKKNGNGPLLDLSFDHRNAPTIMSASVTIHGVSSDSRYLPVGERSDKDENRTQTFELDRQPGAAGITHTEVAVTRMLFVRWAEVTELRFADGSTWHASSDERCQAAPSGFHLIDAPAR